MATAKGDHQYEVTVEWTGNRGTGTSGYQAYERDHIISSGGKPIILGSSDPAFRGNVERWNPEDLLVASLSACHKLWYLHLCAIAGISVLAYRDNALGTMSEDVATGGGRFIRVMLRPHVTIRAEDNLDLALQLHDEAHTKCFIASSVNFPVLQEPTVERAG